MAAFAVAAWGVAAWGVVACGVAAWGVVAWGVAECQSLHVCTPVFNLLDRLHSLRECVCIGVWRMSCGVSA